jgi:F-type H+-transporting ATPase subunit b
MGEQYLELISLNVWHIVVTIANLFILVLILKKFLWKPVKKVVAERQNQVESIYREATDSRDAAERDRLLYEEKLNNAQNEAEDIVRTATQKADRLSDEIVNEAKQKAVQTMKRAEEDIELEKKKAMNELKNEISGISVQIAESVVGREINEEDHRELIDSFIDSL